PHQGCWQIRQLLIGCSHDHRFGEHPFQRANEVNNERLTVEEEQGFWSSHPRAFTTSKHHCGGIEERLLTGEIQLIFPDPAGLISRLFILRIVRWCSTLQPNSKILQ